MTVAEVAKKMEVSPSLVYCLCAKGELAYWRIGSDRGTIRIEPSEVDAYLARKKITEPRTRPTAQATPVVQATPRLTQASATSSTTRLADVARALLGANKRA